LLAAVAVQLTTQVAAVLLELVALVVVVTEA
jgi:hypothetical protein